MIVEYRTRLTDLPKTYNIKGKSTPMNINTIEKRKQILELRTKVLQAEQERVNGAKTMSISEVRKALKYPKTVQKK